MTGPPFEPTLPASGLRSLPRNVWVLTVVSFLTDVSSEMVVNLVPLFLASVLGVRTSIIGLIEGVAETTASLTKLYSGAISDRIGKRKGLTVLGYGLSTVSKPFLYFATTWQWVLGVRFADRMGKGIRTAPRDALMAGSVDEKQRGLAFGLHRAGDTAGAFVGLLIAAIVIWQTQTGVAQITQPTFQLIVLISFFPALLAVLVLALGAREVAAAAHPREGAAAKKSSVPVFSLAGLDSRFRFFLLSLILFTLGNSSDAFITLRGQERGLTVLQIMGMLLTFNAVYTIFAGPLGALSDRIGRRKLILGGWVLYGLIYLGFALAQTGWQIWALYGLYGLFYASTEGAAKALVADLVPDERRGQAYGMYNAAIGIVALPASLIAGLLWQGLGAWTGLGPAAPFVFGGLMALAAGLLFWRAVR
jgi:MFS family permease